MDRVKPIFPPSSQWPGGRPKLQTFIKHIFTLPTLLALGAGAQGLLCLVLPRRYAFLPLIFFVLRNAIRTAFSVRSGDYHFTKLGVIPGRTTAQLPKPGESEFSGVPSDQDIVVFHLGARCNHPLGVLSPGGKELGEHFDACNRELMERKEEFGCLGYSQWLGTEDNANGTILAIYYFRDIEGLNRFAHDVVHRRAWEWYHGEFARKRGWSHIGIFHEAFQVPAGAWENIYVNMPPTLMGAAATKSEDGWVRTLIEANGLVWRSQYSRMGRK
ncbi:uncharacterized protein CTHT_0040220 [Thermochaetoides thermophila DSM 1495]|uniref:Monooxygenase n=1 Tax=Chaetomium thermophilum (strain DSM 1495 / CBS 144.50 / IMI 039719) TaxID=759272 RepID=G0S8T0_CHATD|nr:hypothetical protein CTHT_0040220 [Thermochaetoides thermophila DSM 1495]EGS20283.1 hypothetical protein CTHT_0040220 [Thermochaetoides thermophila DSM 1495]